MSKAPKLTGVKIVLGSVPDKPRTVGEMRAAGRFKWTT
jgi:hypothetical protein